MASSSSGSGKAADKDQAKDPAAKPAPADQSADQNADDNNSAAPGFMGNSGPGTGQEPAEDNVQRMPTQQPVHAESGPLNPSDAKTQVEPKHGYADSSTDDTYAAIGNRTIAGENHEGLVDDDGNDVSADSMFEDDDNDSPYLTVKDNVSEKFTYANAPDHPQTRLLLTKGQKIPRARAKKIQSSTDRKQEPTFGAQRDGS